MYIYLILKRKDNPYAPSTTHQIDRVTQENAWEKFIEYKNRKHNSVILKATLMLNPTNPIQDLYP